MRKSNVFEAVKQAVPTRQAAESYGVRVGRNGMTCCPFHDDKHPSMKIDRRFHCFGCQADGDVIDFTARLFGLNSKDAALKDRLRQCVFGGSSNTLDFLPLDRAGNRRFLPIMIDPENAEVHILEDEDASRDYLLQVWAEAMTLYRSGHYSVKFSKSIQRQLVEVQKNFMPEDTEAGQIQGFLETYSGNQVCSKQLFKEALGHTFEEPKRWQLHNINEIMNTAVTGWKPFTNPRMFSGYGRQRGWERADSGNEQPGNEDGFVELTEEECRQMEFPKEWIA